MTVSKKEQQLVKLEKAVADNSIVDIAKLDPVRQAMALSKGLTEVAKALDPLMDEFLPLAGSPLGFRLDGQYGKPELRASMVEATLRGLPLVGNHFNVIQGRAYVTKEGYEFLVRNHPSVFNLQHDVLQPEEIKPVKGTKDVAAHMPFVANWVDSQGTEHELRTTVYVRMYGGNSSFYDGLVGKATRRGLKKVYESLVGKVLAPPDADDLPDEEATVVDAEVITSEPDKTVEKSHTLAETLARGFLEAGDVEELDVVSGMVSDHKKAGDLSPSDIKGLKKAFEDACERLGV